jgi:hypothetical protein
MQFLNISETLLNFAARAICSHELFEATHESDEPIFTFTQPKGLRFIQSDADLLEF